ncbi:MULTISPECIES: tetratricopeptide repeat protein [Pseudomonas]|uniref:Tetratricopeptide repeat protein 38 n=1 Tax=Pseudomonas quercus TaxID=2722792 RepID=A0ABX0YIT9_9PSED|nr:MULTISPECIES: tetratricopeptide repeat protein [Pseudomonas]MBF7143048.1 tetratricopeptide repeat protein [Pseudomonas sp. LY10J]NJP01923.1 tetratricopeptide repeat protein [Pseudomonas quercus]
MTTQWKTDGISGFWPEANGPFLALRGMPEAVEPGNEHQALYRQLLSGFDRITSCEIKELYRFKLLLDQVPSDMASRPELNMVLHGFRAWVNFDYEAARAAFVCHIKVYPTDVVALFFLHMLDFCTGKTTRLKNQFPVLDAALSAQHPLYSYYLSMKAFVLCECGLFGEAFDIALEAVNLVPGNIYGIHAAAHALHELGRWAELAGFLESRKPDWIDNPGMRMHVYWHLAIAYERCKNTERALTAFDALYKLKDSPFAKQDLDAVGFLWRLRLKAADGRYHGVWKRLAVLWSGGIFTSTSYFHKLHAAFAFSASNQPLLIEKQIAESDGFGVEPKTHLAGVGVLKAIHLFTLEEYGQCLELLRDTRAHWHLLGGSHAQREILELTLDYAAQQTLSVALGRYSA